MLWSIAASGEPRIMATMTPVAAPAAIEIDRNNHKHNDSAYTSRRRKYRPFLLSAPHWSAPPLENKWTANFVASAHPLSER